MTKNCTVEKNFSIILNPVDINKFTPNNYKNKIFNIMLLGVWRDFDLLKCSIDTLNYLKKDIFKTINIIGPFKNDIKSNLIEHIKNYSNYDFKINLVGEVKYNDLEIKIRENSILLHLKSGDWCPNAVIEAMSCGLPVVCQEFGGVNEIVGDSGEIINYDSHKYDKNLSKLAAEAINRVYESYELYSVKSRKRAENYHDISKVCENYYADIIS